MSELWTTLAMILIFTLIGGFFAASETALVSLRDSQVQRLVDGDHRRGPRLRALLDNPNRFLAAVQVGVTLAGFISAAFGASRISPVIAGWMVSLGVPARIADPLAFVGATVLIVYISLVLGELVPKRLALQRTESVALLVATPIDVIASIARPFIWLLSVTTNGFVRILGLNPDEGRVAISGEELRGMVAAHTELTAEERELIDDVFEAGDTELREVMIPRTEVTFLDRTLPVFKAAAKVASLPHSRYPVIGDSPDDVIGFVHVRDLLNPGMVDRSVRLEDIAREVQLFPGSKRLIPALSEMRRGGHHLAVVADEYGGTAGIVTMEDLVEELVGDIHDEYDTGTADPAPSRPRSDEPFEVDGLLNIEDFAEDSGILLSDGPYETVAGWFVAQTGVLPSLGDRIRHDGSGVHFEVIELDARRIARLRVTPSHEVSRLPATSPAQAAAPQEGAAPTMPNPSTGPESEAPGTRPPGRDQGPHAA